jgi:hypothetical protein
MLAWWDTSIEGSDATGKYIRSAYAMPVAGGEPLSEPQKIVTDLFGLTAIATDGVDYMTIGERDHFCAPLDFCRTEVIGVRIDGETGAPIDADALAVSNAPPGERRYPWPGGLTYDGTEYIATYQLGAVFDSPFDNGSYVFANRVDVSGSTAASEHIGFLVDDTGRASESRVVTSATGPVVIWEDGADEALEEPYPHPGFASHVTQRIFGHAPGAGFPLREIGAIGAIALDEGEIVRMRLAASGLNASTAVFSASNLPAGAVFDAATQLFQWRPGELGSASAPSVTFHAEDGTNSVEETVSFSVAETIAALQGLVRLANGDPVAGVTLEIKGTADRRRMASTSADGRYVAGQLIPGRAIRLRAGKATRKKYVLAPKTITVIAEAGDVTIPDFIATPK